MQKVDALLEDYATYHQTKGNKACHFIGIPLIIFGILALLRFIPVASFTAAEVLIVASLVYYLLLNWRLAVSLLLVVAFLDLAAYAISSSLVGIAAFITGWIFQGIGHAVFEKKSPAFLKNVVHLMVGPIFLLNELLHIRPAVMMQRTS